MRARPQTNRKPFCRAMQQSWSVALASTWRVLCVFSYSRRAQFAWNTNFLIKYFNLAQAKKIT